MHNYSHMKLQYLFILFAVALTACDPVTPENTAEHTNSTSSGFQTERFFASLDNCDKSDDNCTYMEVTYPVFEASDRLLVNQFIDGIKSPVFDPDLRMLPLDSIASDFLANYKAFKRDFPESSQRWFMEHSLQWVDETDSTILISAAINEYGGGAHGNYAINYYQVSKKDGKPLKLADLYSQEEIRRMSVIMSVSIDPSIALLTETIYPNDNFILSGDSITFVYNPYEIAPYSEGVIRLTLPRDQRPIM